MGSFFMDWFTPFVVMSPSWICSVSLCCGVSFYEGDLGIWGIFVILSWGGRAADMSDFAGL